MKRYFLAALIIAIVLATAVVATGVVLAVVRGRDSGESASSGEGPSISGKYVYKGYSADESPTLDFKSDGTVVVTVPGYTDPTTQQQTYTRKLTYYYETSSDLVKMWQEKKAMTSSAPSPFFLIYKGTLIDGTGAVLVKEGTASEEVPSSSTPSSPP